MINFEHLDPEDSTLDIIEYVDVKGDTRLCNLSVDDLITTLASDFKAELQKLGVKFCFNENDARFSPLRKYYATALKYGITSIRPDLDDKFNLIKSDVGFGLEWVYYDKILITATINKINQLFFVDNDNKYLYHSSDRKSLLFDDWSGEYGAVTRRIMGNNARMTLAGVKGDIDDYYIDSDVESSWVHVYESCLRVLCFRNEKSMEIDFEF